MDKRLGVWIVWYVCVKWTYGWIASNSTTLMLFVILNFYGAQLEYHSYIAGKFDEFTLFEQLAKRLLIVSTNINSFSLASHRQFAKFTIHSRYTIWQYQSSESTSIKIHI